MIPPGQPADAREREIALDPSRSFIVQAPAGSGKTELLIQRYLGLLSVVEQPEEILAITFTRKAAAEMRKRIEASLASARAGMPPSAAYLRRGYELARVVVARDRQRKWALAEQPARLRISTIDAVNVRLGRRVPLTAGITALHAMLEDATPIYREAARQTLTMAEDPDEAGAAVRILLAHCDNDALRTETLLKTMLQHRDQWLGRTGSGRVADYGELREWLEDNLRELVERRLVAAQLALPADETEELVACLAHAAECRAAGDSDHAGPAWQGRDRFPAPIAAELEPWRDVAATLLRGNGGWRVTVDRRVGFPVDTAEQRLMKERAVKLLGRLRDAEAFRAALEIVAALPEPRYEDAQWTVIEALWKVLPLTVASLKRLFAERGQTDYTEVAQEAIAALGADDEASELRLALDYQIRHVLVDEFQDTSRSQYELLRRLTEGWELEADRSVFLVGDPMQSIYRFREAEVGLFLDTRDHGLGGVRPEFLRLTTNFRSDRAVVDWFDAAFAEVFPPASDRTSGAVAFAPSESLRDSRPDSGVAWHAVPVGAPAIEADRVLELVRDHLRDHGEETIGILVRSRSHATAIAAGLRRGGIDYTATGLERLDEQPLVHDLLALTRALTHPGDRLAWLACLRAPWCGLTLADLHALAWPDRDAGVWNLINDAAVTGRLSVDGQARLSRCRPILQAALERRGAISLRDLVESAWLRLGGPATAGDDDDLEPADIFFSLLDTLDAGFDCADGAELLERLGERSVTRSGRDPRVQILTMHKAKGLEFDTVILPGLGLTTRTSDRALLLFDEFVRQDSRTGLIVAPINSGDRTADPIYDLLWRFETERNRYEQDRLLYVAVTRARRRLHLFAQLRPEDGAEGRLRRPASNTLLARLWPIAEREIDATGIEMRAGAQRRPGERRTAWREAPLRRMPANWAPPALPAAFGTIDRSRVAGDEEPVEFEWASPWAKHAGSVVHRWLQHIAAEGVEAWNADRVVAMEPQLLHALRRAGVDHKDLALAADRVMAALQNTLTDEHGRWILSAEHADIANEVALTTAHRGQFANHVIDRTFVSEDGTRWIIDYKTSSHEGSHADAFLASESERYRPQLRRYRDAMAQLDDRPIRTALYFPLLQILHELDCDA
ncbi:MAG: UvrD-helicase domain-containing protein [Gammaproteobacteria bacterium]